MGGQINYATTDRLESLLNMYDLEEYYNHEERKKQQNEFDEKVKVLLNEEQQEKYRWLSGLSNHREASFSRKWAQRWVCKRAYEFGWSDELFSGFEKFCSYGRGHSLGGGAMERVGKKYQWMAFHEFLARLSDTYQWINRGYSDLPDDDYGGPWQINLRDIDPTIWAKRNGEYKTYHNEHCTWWQPYNFPFPAEDDPKAKAGFLWDEKTIPEFSKILKRNNPEEEGEWAVLRGFWSENKKYSADELDSPYLDGWFRINAICIRKGDFDSLLKRLKGQTLCDPSLVSVPSTQHEGFFGEYPWHTIYKHLSGWQERQDNSRGRIPVKHFVPYAQYEWESGGNDYSIDSSLRFNVPAKELIQEAELKRAQGKWGCWEHGGKVVFSDPSIEEYGPSYVLMSTDFLQKWLSDNNMELIWLIGGEKQMFSNEGGEFFGRLVFSGIYRYEQGKPTGSMRFTKEQRDG
ncbi:hypothetical protein CTT31_16100 [Pseudoalteromonas maricaloris]|uniref:hypothetical protein n=1 Tax=Pseudoalteromonas maricaloris TaxID=184924 RepID=UPI0021ADEA2F|nr:hypothetical protein [Pseudoalteromonas flavipulchra]USE70556.1 hypothetical protein CTT31_16100 [Pseudoalteromonas flavipulchra]